MRHRKQIAFAAVIFAMLILLILVTITVATGLKMQNKRHSEKTPEVVEESTPDVDISDEDAEIPEPEEPKTDNPTIFVGDSLTAEQYDEIKQTQKKTEEEQRQKTIDIYEEIVSEVQPIPEEPIIEENYIPEPDVVEEPITEEPAEIVENTNTYYTPSDFKRLGVLYFNGYKWTWYSERVLPGGGLTIPGRHLDEQGYVCDENNYICLASMNFEYGAVLDTPLGKQGKIYDYCETNGVVDVYVGW